MYGAWRCLCACVLLVHIVCTGTRAVSTPESHSSFFPNLPSQIRYFRDSPVLLWHDGVEGVVYRSWDEGRSWNAVQGPQPGQAALVILHPHDKNQAYILSRGTEHWRTANRGESWQRFSTPDPPSTMAGSPLDFHADPNHSNWVLFIGQKCTTSFFRRVCHDTAFYTLDGFASAPNVLLDRVQQCHWAKMTPQVAVPEQMLRRVLCIAWDESVADPSPNQPGSMPSGMPDMPPFSKRRDMSLTRLFVSDDLFRTRTPVTFDDMPHPRGFLNMGRSGEFLVAAVQNGEPGDGGELRLYVSRDADHWTHAQFPHGALTHEHAYTVLEGPKYHLVVNVADQASHVDALYMSDSTGANFSMSIANTVRNADGMIDYEHMMNAEGVAIVNVRAEDTMQGIGRVQTRITHDEGASWLPVKPPATEIDGRAIPCDAKQPERCALHLHAVFSLRNIGHVFTSTAPGLMMGVGTIGDRLKPYSECDTFLSTDAGLSWRMVARRPHKHVFADQGGLIVIAEDAPSVDAVHYSIDYGATWTKMPLPEAIEPVVLTTEPDGTALKVIVAGLRAQQTDKLRYAVLLLDFSKLSLRTCNKNDFERFYPSTPHGPCVFGRRQWYTRRKVGAACFVRDKFHEPEGHDEPCACTRADFECDFGFARDEHGECVRRMLLPVPPGVCTGRQHTFRGSSGYRRIPGNMCVNDPKKPAIDEPILRPCTDAVRAPGAIKSASFEFSAPVAEVLHFDSSPKILVRLNDGRVFQSGDDGNTWAALPLAVHGAPPSRALRIVQHAYEANRAYIITQGTYVHYTRDGGKSWHWFEAPLEANGVGVEPLHFHPHRPAWLLWIGSRDCLGENKKCTTELWYTTAENHAKWQRAAKDVRKCAFVATREFPTWEPSAVICEVQKSKAALPGAPDALDLVVGNAFFTRARRTVMQSIVGFSVFSEYMVVAMVGPHALFMYVSLDGITFAPISLPPALQSDHSAYTVLDSVTRSVFLHATTTPPFARAQWGHMVKSNSNGTYYAMSLANVNRDERGFVDFEKMQGMNGIALTNVVANTEDASVSGHKELRTLITHNDGATWNAILAPPHDSAGNLYACNAVGCDLHLHNLLERPDLLTKPTSPSAVGLMLATGNVGRSLRAYRECDTFFTRDGGFTWQELHKGTHKWEFGAHGSLIVLVDDEHITDTLKYTFDQGLSWHTHRFSPALRVRTIDTVPEDTQRKFVLFGDTQGGAPTAVFVDFTDALDRECVYDPRNLETNDFERWSPSQQRAESCLFGQQLWYWRRKRDRRCYVSKLPPQAVVEKKCTCSDADFECEFNHFRNANGECEAYAGAALLPADPVAQCARDAPGYDGYWYERTNVRKIPLSQCMGGVRPDRGKRHKCRRASSLAALISLVWWLFVAVCLAAMAAAAFTVVSSRTRRGYSSISLGADARTFEGVRGHALSAFESVQSLARIVWANAVAKLHDFSITRDFLRRRERPFSHYHMLSTDEDAEILQDYDAAELEEERL